MALGSGVFETSVCATSCSSGQLSACDAIGNGIGIACLVGRSAIHYTIAPQLEIFISILK